VPTIIRAWSGWIFHKTPIAELNLKKLREHSPGPPQCGILRHSNSRVRKGDGRLCSSDETFRSPYICDYQAKTDRVPCTAEAVKARIRVNISWPLTFWPLG